MEAYGAEMEISHKHSREIASAIKGMQISKAKKFLEDVIALRQVVPLKRYNKELPHRRGIMAGRWPRKAAAHILKVLKSAQANAEQKGKSEESLFIKSITVSRGRFKRMYGAARALGRRGRQRGRTTNLRVILTEKQIGEKPQVKVKDTKKEVKKGEKPEEAPKKEKVGKETAGEKAKKEGKKPKTSEEKKAEKWLKSVR